MDLSSERWDYFSGRSKAPEDSPRRAALDATVSGPRHPGRGVREWDLKINKEAGTPGRAGSPLHAESAAPTGVVALPRPVL